jgi:beta-N-acetylhexosaminidase
MNRGKVRIPIEKMTEAVRGRKVGVLTNGLVWMEEAGDDLAAVIRQTCRKEVLLYAEHGYRGDGGPGMDTATSGKHVSYSNHESRCLYARNLRGRKELLDDLDIVVLGLPSDVGVRHDSFKRTTCHLMELAAQCGKPAVLVDFPNPMRGDIVEGNLPDPAYAARSMTQWNMPYVWHPAPITLRHGLTNGELALMAKDCLSLNLDLQIIKMEGWRRDMWWDDTGLAYVLTDPSIYNLTVNLGHLCTGLFQGTTLAWGIGTAEPFCVLGAPWISDDRVLCAMREYKLPGVTWSRAFFIPRWNEPGDQGILWRKYAGEPCNGIRIHFTDRDAVRIAEVQITLLVEFLRLYPGQFDLVTENDQFDKRLEDLQWSRRLKEGESAESILCEWKEMSARFEQMRKPYLLY